MTTSALSASRPARGRIFHSLFLQVLVAAILGILIGVYAPDFAKGLKIFSDGFLKLITMIVAPIVFCVVVHGIAGAGDLKKVGRLGLIALVYFEAMTTVALILGVALGYLFAPGHGLNRDPATLNPNALATYAANARKLQSGGLGEFLLNIVPTTVFDAFARNDVLQVLFFAILFGVAIALVGAPAKPISEFVEAISRVLFRIMGLIVRLAPLGVLGAVAYTVGQNGVGSLQQLLSLVGLFYLAVGLFVFFVIFGAVLCSGRVEHLPAGRLSARGVLIVLATASSDAVLPQIMRKLEKMGVEGIRRRPRHSDRLSFNLDAFSIYLTLVVVFIAQATNTPLSLGDLLIILGVSLVTSKGAHGVPGIRDRHPRGNPARRPGDPRGRPHAGAVRRLVCRHRARGRQPRRQLRRERRRGGGHRRPRSGESERHWRVEARWRKVSKITAARR